MKAVKAGELFLTTDNKVGKLEEISRLVKAEGVNIRAISAYVVGDQAFFRLVTSDNDKAKQALSSLGSIEDKEVVIVDMPDKVGELYSVASKLKEAAIDLSYIYGTTSEPDKPAVIIFSSDDNDKALQVIGA